MSMPIKWFLSNSALEMYPDFFPWRKSNNSVQNVDYLQKGYMENPLVANEGGTARGSMLPLLKQWTSLPALSYFLLNSMEARDQVSRVVSPSTFRPPPRVTLTDHKREAWLRDLASPSIPLRRLSRTIPHGIKNKNLLDQCCNKQIPISRAVWFARCVGANELRGLKRRGNNSVNSAMTEALWIHDWTEEVVEYIEKTIKEFDSIVKREARDTSSNSSNWQIKIEYLTRLLAHLYHEDLLEKGLVLRWCLKSFQNSMPDTLPMALIYVKMFWQDLTSSRVLSQSLALALLNQYSQLLQYNANSSAKLIIDELGSKVCAYISELFIQSPDSFVIPNHWRNLGSVLTEALKRRTSQKVWDLVGVIRMRNESLIVSDAPLVRGIRNKRSLFIKLLDSFKVPYDFEDFAKQMKSWPLDSDEILKIIFEWTVSNIRTSQPENLYICVALCKYWQTEFGWNISKSFQSFLVYQVRDVSKFCMDSIHDLIYEFLKHDILSIGGYFRSLISSGLLFLDRLKEKAEPHVLILCNLPLHKYAVEFRNQQVMLLEDLNRYDSEEDDRVENVKRMLRTRLFYLFHKHQESSFGDQDEELDEEEDEFVYGDLNEEEIQMLTSLYKGSKVNVSEWLTQIVIEQIEHNLKFNLSKFAMLQRVFEFLRDSENLFGIIFKVIPKVNSRSLLYLLANTLKDNLKVFSTFMDLTELIQLFITQYNSLKTKSRISVGLWDLIQFTLSQLDEKSSLRPELEMILKSSAASTPYPTDITSLSPVSDIPSNNNDKYNNRELELFAEFGISEPSFDSHTIGNYFESISGQFLEACKSKDELKNGENEVKVRKLVKIFQRLRDVDLHVFNNALTKWLRDQVEPDLYYDSDAFLKILMFLVAYECLSLEKIADMFMQSKSMVRLPGPSVISTDLMLNLISSQKMNYVWLKAGEKLLLDYQRRLFEKSSNCRIYLKYIVQEILEENTDNMDWANQDVLKFLAWCCNVKLDVVLSTLIEPVLQNSKALFKVKKLFRALLKTNAEDDDPTKELLDVIKVVSEFNLPLCQVQFKILTSSMQISGTSNSDIAEFIVGRVHECVGLIGKVLFGDLLIHLDKSLKGQILVCCEVLFLQSKKFPVVCQVSNGQENLKINIVDYLFEMIDAIADSATENIMKGYGFDLTDSLDKLVQLSENGVDDEVIKEEEQQVQMEIDSKPIPSVKIQDVRLAILLYVKIVMIESQTFPFDSSCREKLISGLMSLLDTPVVTGLTELHGLLIDALNSIKGELVMEKTDQKTVNSKGVGLQSKLTMNAVGNVSTIKSKMDTDLWSFDSNIKPSGTSYLTDLMVYDRATDTYSEVNVRSFDLLEDANPTIAINDVPLSLAKFDCIVEKNNPD